ncbi:MAG: hypothetical protein L6420_10730 [Elusimicrobia bacterium]|nr:hypothetical protein [Elusimicrobiota bacterium]
MNRIKPIKLALLALSFALITLLISSAAANEKTDMKKFEESLKEADNFFNEGMNIKKSGAEKKKYKKQFKQALEIYSDIRKELYDPADMRIKLSGEISRYISGGYGTDSQFAEDIVTAEITILPPILYRTAALTLSDIVSDDGLFFPPLIRLSEDNFKEYQKALSIPPFSNKKTGSVSPKSELSPKGVKLEKENFNRILNSPLAQQFYINAKLSNIRKTVAEIGDAQSADDLYRLGNAMLLEMFYKRLEEALTSYRKAQEKIQSVAHPPQYTEALKYMERIEEAKKSSPAIRDRQRCTDAEGQKPKGLELPLNFDWERVDILKKAVEDSLKFSKLPLLEGIPEGKAAWKAGRIVEKNIKKSRSLMFAEYRQLVQTNRYFNILPISEEIISVFKKAVETDKDNAYYHLKLGNAYRMLAFNLLINQLDEANEHFIGTGVTVFPKWKYSPKNEKEKIDLSTVNELLGNAFNEYKAVLQLSPELGERVLGIFYLSLISINPSFAQNALDCLNRAGNNEYALLAKEYAGQLIERAAAEQTHLKFAKDFKDMSGQIKDAYVKMPQNSEFKTFAKSIMSERSFSEIFAYLTRKRAIKRAVYEKWISMLEQNKTIDENNPYISLLQGYLTQKKGMTLSMGAALGAVGESLSFQARSVSDLNLLNLSVERPSKENFDAYALEKGGKLAEHYKRTYSGNVNIVVKRYNEKDLLEAVQILSLTAVKNPDLALAQFYLGRAYSLLCVYYASQEEHLSDKNTVAKYEKLAQDTFKQYVVLSEGE